MIISIFGYFFLVIGLLILSLPFLLVELSRPRDWLYGALFLFLGLFLLVENDLFRYSINLFVISMAILLGKMVFEISQNRWNQLSLEEKKRIVSFNRWIESVTEIGQVFALLAKGFLNFFKSFEDQSQKPLKTKKWVHPDLNEEIKTKAADLTNESELKKISNEELSENEESS